MQVIVVRAGEPVPGPAHPVRWLRAGLVCRALAARGHEVSWVVSTFDHGAKHHVFPRDTTWGAESGIELVALKAPAYADHRSLRRLVHHEVLAWKLRRYLAHRSKPDLILAALPVPEMALVAVQAAARWKVPCVVDCRDMWPDIFREGRHGVGGLLVRAATAPMERTTRAACAGAAAILGHTEAFVDWGVAKAGRPRGPDDRAFAFGYAPEPPDPERLAAAERRLDAAGVPVRDDLLRVAFFATLTRHFDLDTVLAAFQRLADKGIAAELVVCGDGDRAGPLRAIPAGHPTIRWLGWQEGPALWALLRRSQIGLAPYWSSSSFVQSVPNKIIEYLSAGLPVLSSLEGTSAQLLSESGAGWQFPAGDSAALAVILEELAAHRAQVREAGARGRAVFESRFQAEHVYGEYAAHLERLAATHRG